MNHGLYLHIPFCTHRCAYCDFNTYAGQEALIPAYVDALCAEAWSVAKAWEDRGLQAPLKIETVFFGGGTPSLLGVEQVRRILGVLRNCFWVDPDAEITLEANPGTVTPEALQGLREAGVNRLSYGVQSADGEILRLLERSHNFRQAEAAVHHARSAGFDNLSLDLMLGVMSQTMDSWRTTLEHALGLRPEHLSLYMLSVEDGTPLAAWVRDGVLPSPDPDLAAEMYEHACEVLEDHGYAHYEISNWARRRTEASAGDDEPGLLACRHNLRYWRNLSYLGLGAGAHGSAEGFRYANVLSPQAYIQRLSARGREPFPFSAAAASRQPIDRETEMQETMLMGLRLLQEGVRVTSFQSRFGQSPQQAFPELVERWEAEGLLQAEAERLCLTRRGWLLANQVFMDLV